MKSFKSLLIAALLLLSLPWDAEAKCGRKLSTDSVDELTTFSGAPATGDYIPICDTSANVMKKVDASNITLAGAFNGTVGATTPSTGAFTSLTTTLGVAHTRTPAADTGTTNNGSSVAYTVPADTTGTNTHNAYNVSPTISNATGGTNAFNAAQSIIARRNAAAGLSDGEKPTNDAITANLRMPENLRRQSGNDGIQGWNVSGNP